MTTDLNSTKKPKLSVAILARNEQDYLPETIRSVQSIADQVFVLDTGSTDSTMDVARDLGADVSQVPWNDDFAAVRNLLLHEMKGDWVLWLDAGEQLDASTADELRRYVDKQTDAKRVCLVMVTIPAAERNGSAEQAAKLRLMPCDEELRFAGRVAESLDQAIELGGYKVDMAPGRIHRHARHHLPERRTAIAHRNLRLLDLETSGGNDLTPRCLLLKGESHCDLGEMPAAREAFRDAIHGSDTGTSTMLEAYYGLLTTYDGGDEALRQEQVTTALESLEIFPLDAQLLCAMGTYMQQRGHVELAARSFQTAVQYGQVDLETWHLDEVAEVNVACLALCLQHQNRDEESRDVLEAAIETYPTSERLRRTLLDLHIKAGRDKEAIEQVEALCNDATAEPMRRAVLGACHAVRKEWTEALGNLQAAYLAGLRQPICLRWLAITLLSNAQVDAARPILRQWEEVEPGNTELQAYLKAVESPENLAKKTAASAMESRQLRVDRPQGEQEEAPHQATTTQRAETTGN